MMIGATSVELPKEVTRAMSFMEMKPILYENWGKKLVGILKGHESNPKNLGPRDLGEVVIVITTTTMWQILLSRKVSQKLA